jgi:ABC-type multidrug transport system fused ATPase/permease subunit
VLILTRSLSLSIIAAFHFVFIPLFFLHFNVKMICLSAFLFTAILLFIMYFASNRMIPIPVPLHTLFCGQLIPSSPIMAFIVVISITLYMFIKQLRYEFTIITLGKDYFTILGVSKTSIELLKAFITTLAAMIAIILVAGWEHFSILPFLSKTNDESLIVLALCITLLCMYHTLLIPLYHYSTYLMTLFFGDSYQEDAMLTLNNISSSLNNQQLLSHINAEFFEGEVIGIIGKPASGKSLLLQVIAQHIQYDGTSCLIKNQ